MTSDIDDDRRGRLRFAPDAALATLFAEFGPRLERVINLRLDRRLSGRIDTADVLQESYLEARKKLPRYLDEPQAAVFVWLYGVVLDTLTHVHRRHLADKRHAGRDVSLGTRRLPHVDSSSLAAWMVDNLSSPSTIASRNEMSVQLEDALTNLDEIDQQVLVLRHLEQLTNDEVAGVLGIKKAAASRRYIRALTRFREVLKSIPGLEL